MPQTRGSGAGVVFCFTDGQALTDSTQKTTLHAFHVLLSVPPFSQGSHTAHSCTFVPHDSLWDCVYVCVRENVFICVLRKERFANLHKLCYLLGGNGGRICLFFLTRVLRNWRHMAVGNVSGNSKGNSMEPFCIFWLHNLKRYLPVLQLLRGVKNRRLFLTRSTEIMSKKPAHGL